MDFLHVAERVAAQQINGVAEFRVGRPLVAHLRGDVVLLRSQPHLAGFLDRARQRLLAIDSLAGLHRHHRDHRVVVIRHAHRHRVDALADGVEKFTEVIEPLRLDEAFFLGLLVEGIIVDVADRDDVAVALDLLGIAGPFAADADAGELQPLVGRLAGGSGIGPRAASADESAQSDHSRGLDEIAPVRTRAL